MQLERLRLVGFKSFVDATQLAIEPGLTGIVGPNGCGKSNLVEALRWVMGENSARRLRGDEMDDVIFSGTTGRPARNIAEVALVIDNSARGAPAFNDREQIEIVRRIERGGGSTYRINGREARARDVQLLFADRASGAHSAAMVTQGRVGALIDAKPAERRLLLEDAAGTAGLHARRHETELKLRAAEDNLQRLDDVVATMEAQLEVLKKQARQATRYRRLAEHIRRTEALLFHARWLTASAEAEDNAAELRAAERDVAAAAERAQAETRAREAADATLPPLREAASAAAAELQRLTQAREALEAELKRVIAARAEAERRVAQLAADTAREGDHLTDAEAALARLSDEADRHAAAERTEAPMRADAAGHQRERAAELAAADAALQQATEAAADAAARRAGLERRRQEIAERLARIAARRAEGDQQQAAARTAMVRPAALGAAATTVAEAAQRVEECRTAVEAGEHDIAARLARNEVVRQAARAIEMELARLQAEAEALAALVGGANEPGEAGEGPRVLDSLRVADGFETAVGAVFEDELAAPLADAGGGRFWRDLPPFEKAPPLPAGARPLADVVGAPPALARSLGQAGWVDGEEVGHRLQLSLAPGQRLVDRDGRLWRWDGFTRLAAAPSGAAQQLRQRNRLRLLEAEIARAETEAGTAGAQEAAAQAAWQQAAESDRLARRELRGAEATLAAARTAEAELARRALAAETRLAAIAEAIDKLAGEYAETQAQADATGHELAARPDPAATRDALDRARRLAAQARAREGDARAACQRLEGEAASRHQRLAAIALEAQAWAKRRDDAAAQRSILLERRGALEQEVAGLAARPAAIATEGEALGGAAAEAAQQSRHSGDALAEAETRLRAAVEAMRSAEQQLGEARERRARLEGLRDGSAEALARLARDIAERLDTAPEGLAALAGVGADEPAPDPGEAAARLERLVREREAMGPVNLVAESEAQEVGARIEGLTRERADLTEAIARLRRGIAMLDQEARKRLVAAFEQVNAYFAELFAKLFGGGKAYLELAGDADPLAAGLEIMASPPGKRLQTLSLLSGGEQALAALALLFAVFLTNPTPICVLDEVDASLDDANVDRFCSLLGEIADATGTRFLVITHHRITMARVDRLFGVTMAERGVSQLVSVDLARAAQLRQTA
jgi:chromosome segregation protein